MDREAYVWIWLPKEISPVVAGKLEVDDRGSIHFNYGKSYLNRIGENPSAIPIYEPELPLKQGILPLFEGLNIPGCIRDSAPDAWGRRVIINKILGRKGKDEDTSQLNEITYLLESGSDRIGALDFQRSSSEYTSRSSTYVQLDELLESASRVEQGVPLKPELDQALFHGSSIGGARPKALIENQERKYVAKFPLSSDLYNVVKAEFIAMRLAAKAGINVAPVELIQVKKKDILLIERFDRVRTVGGWERKAMVSALTLFGLDEMMARYASYETLAEIIRHRFDDPKETLKELFSRLVFNILCGNTDDHARNHAAFWNGKTLCLTPAYDLCPQNRAVNEATQAMLISGDNRQSKLHSCLKACSQFLLSESKAKEIFNRQREVIETNWTNICDEAKLSTVDRNLLWKRQFLNPFVFEE
ncbi:MAG: type II toxin-antitoxin system HipA family toxin [Pseudomonadota bacterium]